MSETEAQISMIVAIYGIIILGSLVFALILYVLISLPLAEIFAKAGLPKWKAWVPYYSTYLWLQLGGQNGWWVLASLVPGGSYVLAVFQFIAMHRQGLAFGKDGTFVVLGIVLPVVWLFMLGYGRAPYEPGRIAASGYVGPLVGYGAVVQQPVRY
ncbi:MAG: DUF5684 domain-containing protein [Microbacteriaceae bacterium]